MRFEHSSSRAFSIPPAASTTASARTVACLPSGLLTSTASMRDPSALVVRWVTEAWASTVVFGADAARKRGPNRVNSSRNTLSSLN